MSYRTLKRLLGETSLERKCRLLFGTGLLLLIAGSFALYGWLNVRLVYDQNRNIARALVDPIVRDYHRKALSGEFPAIETLNAGPEASREYRWQVYSNETDAQPANRPSDNLSADVLNKQIADEPEVVAFSSDGSEYHYYARLSATANCLGCHAQRASGKPLRPNELMGMVRVSIPLAETKQALARNNAFLITTAIVTAVLAMIAAYAIVRYVIVKPVLHLKDVADEISHGTLDLRADIRTGDEFEELSHAFNRMLRHLITMQEELKDANGNLDVKVDELARVNLRLYETSKLKDEFLATMSHELRTPLNSILGFSDVIAGAENITDKQRRFVGNIQKSGRDLLLLINDILDLAKIESGKLQVEPTEMRLSDLVERQVDAMLPMAEKKNIDLSSSVDLDMPTLRQDAGKLQQILNNLLSNALKFTPEGGRVRVRGVLDDNGHYFSLIIEDSGIGIPLEDQATIFEKFRQGRSTPGQKDTMTREYGGTGLGLSIVKELARLLGGEVFLSSEFGKGSTFTVRLPLNAKDAPQRATDEGRKSLRPRIELSRPTEGAA